MAFDAIFDYVFGFLSDHYANIVSTIALIGTVTIGIFQYLATQKRCPICRKRLKVIKTRPEREGMITFRSGDPLPPARTVVYYECPKCSFKLQDYA